MPAAHNRPQQIVLWVLWISMVNAIVLYQLFLGRGVPQGADPAGAPLHPVALVAVGQVALATVVRWLLLPRAVTTGKVLVAMILGLALCEGAALLGIFLVPDALPGTRLLVWLAALAGALQFAPVYARGAPSPASPFRAE